MRRELTAAAALGAALVMMATQAHAAPLRFRYVANLTGMWTQLDRGLPPDVSPVGQLRFTPKHRTFTVRLDDPGVLDGQTIAVWTQDKEGIRCLRVRTTETLRTSTPGREIMITILGDGEWFPDSPSLRTCTGHATVGTADVGL